MIHNQSLPRLNAGVINATVKGQTPKVMEGGLITLSDLHSKAVVVIHTGDKAARDPEHRKVWQQAHNQAIEADNPLDPEVEPVQSLFVAPRQLEAITKLYPMADSDATKKIIVHVNGDIAPAKLKRLVIELKRQAPNADIYKGNQGQNAEPWDGFVNMVKAELAIVAENVPTLNDEPESVTASLLDMAGEHPLAVYAREVADSIQISRDSTFMIGMGLTSAVVGAAYCVKTPWDADLPLGLYVTAEQPPAAGKSGVMSAFQKPFRAALRRMNDDRNKALDALEAQIDAAEDPAVEGELREQLINKPQPVRGWISNATPEALESEAIKPNDGLFMLASDERGLLNSVFGLLYSKGSPVNMDAALKGFDGGSYVSVRTTRKGFDGEVHGSIVCFAQPGSIEAIMQASGGTGLAERFLWLSDGHQLGMRNHLRPWTKPNSEPFTRLCDEVVRLIPYRPALEKLTQLSLPTILMDELRKAKQQLEVELGDDGRFGNDAVRGAAGKLDLQVMKVASILHITRHLCEGKPVPPNIGTADFEIALNLCRELLERYRQALVSKRIIGFGAEADAVIEYLEKFPSGKDMEQAKNSLRSRAVFKGRSTKQITAAIEKLAAAMIVTIETGITARKVVRLL